jgi:hypothetical protein
LDLFSVVGARFGGIVGYEDDAFVECAEEMECFGNAGEDVVAGPEDAIAVEEESLGKY